MSGKKNKIGNIANMALWNIIPYKTLIVRNDFHFPLTIILPKIWTSA